MCDAVFGAERPEKTTFTSIVFKRSSIMTVAAPVPGDALAGDSEAPFRIAV
jgi:hypothetical protein